MLNTSKNILRFALRSVVLVAIWLVLCGGELSSLVVGVPAIAAALFMASRLAPSGLTIRSWRLARFAPFFLKESLRGGIDAASRAFGLKPRLSCGIIPFETSLPEPAQVFFANVIGLLPGTLTTQLKENSLLVHTLDDTKSVRQDLQLLEERVAHLFAVDRPES